ncbi:hypothetical protein B0X71_19910 (plasmid) [Planococcus lenghuensis]|uniref:Uncharacterized protein n=1 Tax=Planococcus lenghuensis TaxID=2213202 RepID=A0A1Q2L6A4_9BACL|nr:hypothetical protein B0X71_19910 [Planococcus lenghuensis]
MHDIPDQNQSFPLVSAKRTQAFTGFIKEINIWQYGGRKNIFGTLKNGENNPTRIQPKHLLFYLKNGYDKMSFDILKLLTQRTCQTWANGNRRNTRNMWSNFFWTTTEGPLKSLANWSANPTGSVVGQ